MGLVRTFRHSATWQFAAALIVLAWAGAPADAQDSAEVIAVGRCLLQIAPCEGWDWTYRPPLPPVLAAAFPTEGSAGVVLVSIFATAAWVFPARRLSKGQGAGWAIVLALAATPGVRTAALVGDPRCLGVLALLAAAAAVVESRWVAAGVFAAAAALCRAENSVAIPVVCALAAWRTAGGAHSSSAALRATGLAFGSAVATLAPWWAAISIHIGRPTLVSRTWEAGAAIWSQTLTVPLVHLWVGPSAWEGPLRSALRETASPEPLFDFAASTTALWHGVMFAVPAWLAATAAVAGVVWARRATHQVGSGLSAGAMLAPPALFALATRPGRESPEATLLPLLALLILAADTVLGGVLAPTRSRRRRGRAWAALGLGTLWAGWAATSLFSRLGLPPRERTGSAITLSEHLRSSGESNAVGAVFATSHLVRTAGRTWLPLDGRSLPPQVVVARGDDLWAVLGLLIPAHAQVRATPRFGGDGWAVLLETDGAGVDTLVDPAP